MTVDIENDNPRQEGEQEQEQLSNENVAIQDAPNKNEMDGTASSAPPPLDEQTQPQEKKGLFGIFRRRKNKEPRIVNGERDFLDDADQLDEQDDDDEDQKEEEESTQSASDKPEESEAEEDSREESSDNDEEGQSGGGEEDETNDHELDRATDDGSQQHLQQQENTAEYVGNFQQSKFPEEEEEEGGNAEFTSLIGSNGAPNTASTNAKENGNHRKRGFLGRIFRKKSQGTDKGGGANETTGLIGYNDHDTDEEEQFLSTTSYRENRNFEGEDEPTRRQGLLEDYSEENESEDERSNSILDESHSSHGQTFHIDNNNHDYYEEEDEEDGRRYPYETPGNQEMQGRIRGYGNESAIPENGSFTADGSSRFHDAMTDPNNMMMMQSREFDPDMEKKGLLAGVGKVVGNIFRNRRGGFESEEERRRMIAYIDELEWKLRKKDGELQSWKARTEQLEKEVRRLRGEESDEEVEGSEIKKEYVEEEGSDNEVEEVEEEDEEGPKYDLLLMNDSERTNEDDNAEVVTSKEGTLIDLADEVKPTFDPSTETKQSDSCGSVTNVDSHLQEHHQKAESSSEREGFAADLFEGVQSTFQTEAKDDVAQDEQGEDKAEPSLSLVDTESQGVFEDAVEDTSPTITRVRTKDEENDKAAIYVKLESDEDVGEAQYQFLSAISTSISSDAPQQTNVVTPTLR